LDLFQFLKEVAEVVGFGEVKESKAALVDIQTTAFEIRRHWFLLEQGVGVQELGRGT
jgi:hypothetical protein